MSKLEKYLCIDPSGELRWIHLERKPRYGPVYNGAEAISLKDIYPILDCTLCEQVHTCIRGVVLIIDECGRIKDPPKPHNEVASQLYNGWHYAGVDIRGSAVVCALHPVPPDGELDLVPLSESQEFVLSSFIGELPSKEGSEDA